MCLRAACFVVAGLLAVVSSGAAAPPARPIVIATFYPLYEFTREVAGDHAEVVSLVPPGVEPHDWEPSPRDLVHIQKARLFVYNGGGFEPWVEKLLKEVPSKDRVVVRTTVGLPLMRGTHAEHDDDTPSTRNAPAHQDAPKPDRAPLDPHVWLDPVLAQAQVEAIRAGLAKVDPTNAAAYATNAQAYKAKLATLHGVITSGLKQCARRDVVVSHAAFGYLAKRYRLIQVPISGLAPEAEPSPADLAALVRVARQTKVKYVFFESLVSPKLAETLAREIGAQTLVLNPIEGLTSDEQAAGKSYLSLMAENLKNLRTALECR